MENIIKNPWRAFGFSIAISFLLVGLFYPALLVMKEFPMAANGWELQDPVVSRWVIMPALRVWRYELLHNHNWLWSNLRGLGQPLLGNEVQAGPLFPLTLATLWIPEPYFWTVYCLLRLVLIGAMSFLIALRILRFDKLPALVFTLSFGLGLFVLRWMNHPWQNGMLAGLLYLYFLHLSLEAQQHPERNRFGFSPSSIGLIIAVYSLCTCGFPESAAMSGILALLVFLVPTTVALLKSGVRPLAFLGILIFTHLVGFALASPQIFALVEFIGQTLPDYRKGIGAIQFDSPKMLVPMLTRITDGQPAGSSVHYFHLIPLFLFATGMYSRLRTRAFTVFDGSALLCLAFFLFKFFPYWPAFNQFVSHLPIYDHSWFIVYFLTIPMWFFAYYAACGAAYLNQALTLDKKHNEHLRIFSIAAFLLILSLLFYTVGEVQNTNSVRVLRLLYIFLAFITYILYALTQETTAKRLKYFPLFFSLFLILEISASRPIYFMKFSQKEYARDFNHSRPEALRSLLEKNGLSLLENRERSGGGDYVASGIATIDNGSPPIQSARMWNFRSTLFESVCHPFGAAIPLLDQKVPYGYALSSSTLQLTDTIPFGKPADFAKLRYLGKAEDFHVYHDPQALPRAYVSARCASVTQTAALQILKENKSFHLGDVLMENLNVEEKRFCTKYQGRLAPIRILEDTGSQLKLASIPGPAVLSLGDNYYPGWKAIDQTTNKEIEVKPSNYAFRGLLLPEKRNYEIQFIYAPAWLKLSQWLVGTALAILGLMTWMAIGKWMRNRKSPSVV